MIIERLGGLEPLKNVQKTYKPQPNTNTAAVDSVSVSDTARKLAEAHRAAELAAAAPDVRADRIKEVQAKINDPNYINDAVVNIVADRIMDVFGI